MANPSSRGTCYLYNVYSKHDRYRCYNVHNNCSSIERNQGIRKLGEKGESYDSIIRTLIEEVSWKRLDDRWNKILEEDEFIPLDELWNTQYLFLKRSKSNSFLWKIVCRGESNLH